MTMAHVVKYQKQWELATEINISLCQTHVEATLKSSSLSDFGLPGFRPSHGRQSCEYNLHCDWDYLIRGRR